MYLEKLEIQGFKSFANKNVLVFPGMLDKSKRGMTAIVGPNGSGKSNVADAVRWALGEQSIKTLRGKRGEDVIFSGSDKKGRLGMAEVSLYLNNKDRKAPIEYSQIILTRRLFRNGESEYLINNSRARLTDIQIFLAKAKFGQKTYSVIGQGVVEGFLNTSLAERKEFFDEATGVKQFQIKRDDSLNKLRLSYENFNQARMLLDEIEPRLRSLTRQVNKLKKRSEIEKDLKHLQFKYYSKLWHEINDKFNKVNSKFLEIEKIKLKKEKELASLNQELNQMEKQSKTDQGFSKWQEELSGLQQQKDKATQALAVIEARMEVKLDSQGQFDLSWLNSKKKEITQAIEQIKEEINGLEKNIKHEESKFKNLEKEKVTKEKETAKVNSELDEFSSFYDDEIVKKFSDQLKKVLERIKKVSKETDINNIKTTIKEIGTKLEKVLQESEKYSGSNVWEKLQHNLIQLTKDKEEIVSRIHDSNIRISARSERIKLLIKQKEQLTSELAKIETKLKQNQGRIDITKFTQEQENCKNQIVDLDQRINKTREKINNFSQKEEEEKSHLFTLQKKLQNLQEEINQLNIKLNELKINSTRYETKLEDLEIEIREFYNDFKKIREDKFIGHIDYQETKERINNLKRQIDLIGGIDPEIEKEYDETKERFDFLSEQASDLSGAIGSLEKIIKELDLTIKEKFDKEFLLIAKKFTQYFKILFNGGAAKIIKVMDSDLDKNIKEEKQERIADEDGEAGAREQPTAMEKIKFLQKHNATGLAGVEIQATPPGKKIKSIAMLSGGERALTAIALICAIISANPSPFVVLDEVDAALDEANSERFAKILDDLSRKTQFIIITHNRATMRRANILYGITMGDDGISRLLSIKLDEAKARS